MSIKKCITDTLEDLSDPDLGKFCYQLRDRPESPRIRRRDVDNKSAWEITELLVSTFTEPKALQVTVDTLMQMKRNQEAKTLEQETKALLDKGAAKTKLSTTKKKPSPTKKKPSPTKKKPSPTKKKPSPTIKKPSAIKTKTSPTKKKPSPTKKKPSPTKKKPSPTKKKPSPTIKKPSDIKTKTSPTKKKPSTTKNSLNKIQFGKHKGKTFNWLLKNDMDYIAFIVASHQKELEGATGSKMNQHMANKAALTDFVSAYPEAMEEVRFHRAYMDSRDAALKSGKKGQVLVGFGPDRWGTLKDLYESKDLQKIRLVESLRTKKSTCVPKSKMEYAVNYILQRDKAREAATKRRMNSTAKALTKKRASEPCVQSNQPSEDSGPVRKKQKVMPSHY